MSDMEGVGIDAVTAFGWSDDGQHIWVTHKLRDGTEYRLVYPYLAAAQLITLVRHAASSAYEERVQRDPTETAEGADSNVLAAGAVRLGTAQDGSSTILHVTTIDNIPVALQLTPALIRQLTDALNRQLSTEPPAGPLQLH